MVRAKISKDPISQISRPKWTGGVTQAIELWLYKHEALSSNPSPTKKKKEYIQLSRILFSHYHIFFAKVEKTQLIMAWQVINFPLRYT
jgi:hypothetical protein